MLMQAHPSFTEKAIGNISDSFSRNWITEGVYCENALSCFKRHTGLKYAFFAPNGTLAIYLALLALDLPKGSKVIVPSFTFYGSVTPIIFAGLEPIFVDCNEHTYQIDTNALEEAIDGSTSAILAVDIYGRMCDMQCIRTICDKYNLVLIEDAAQGVGVYDDDAYHAGMHADVSTFSLFADKSFTTGEGGLVATNSAQLAEKIMLLRNQGRPNSGTFIHPSLGMNFRVTDLHGGLALEQFEKWDAVRLKRQERWSKWKEALQDCDILTIHDIGILKNSLPFRFAFTSYYSDEITKILQQNNIMVRGFFHPMHLQPKLRKYRHLDCVISENLSRNGLCLPVHELVTDEVIDRVAEGVKKVG